MKDDKNKDTPKNYVSIPFASTVVVQWEDGRPWTHGTIEEKGNQIHHDRSYQICITKRQTIHMKQTTHEANTDLS